MKSEDVLRTLAAMSGGGPGVRTDLVAADTFTWLTDAALGFFDPGAYGDGSIEPWKSADGLSSISTAFQRPMRRLLSKAALHPGEQLIRLGCVWFAGVVDVEGESTQFCFPAMSVPMTRDFVAADTTAEAAVGVLRSLTGSSQSRLIRAGDIEITSLVRDDDLEDALLEGAPVDGGKLSDASEDLLTWSSEVAKAVGIEISHTFPAHASTPTAERSKQGISMHLGCGLYLDKPASAGTRKSSLLSLSMLRGLEDTAFGKVYGEGEIEPVREREVIRLRPLSLRQRAVAGRAGGSDVAVISGAPGTGKSHVLSVVARDAVARGESVLVVAGSPHAVDVLVEHFSATPGPTPVTFGGSRHGNRLAAELSELISRNDVPGRSTAASDDHSRGLTSASRSLQLELEALEIERDPSYRIEVVAELDRAGDLDELRLEVERAANPGFFKFGHRKRLALLRGRLGPTDDPHVRLDELTRKRDALRLIAAGGMSLTPRLDDLASKEDQAAKLRGRQLTDQWISGLGRDEKRTLAQISSAVATNRSARRRALAALDPGALTRAAPLWVGSVRDVDEVLPEVAGLFDIAILDEAAQIDQMNAANALVRAKRTVVCGDPNQLGHTSYVSNEVVESAAKRFQTDPALLNPRSVSTFDIAAAQVPVEVLDEHFRSVPHLIEFSSRRFYGGELHVATRHPANEAADHIHVAVVDGSRDTNRVNQVEVGECLRLVEQYAATGSRSIGLISPFRAQADAIEQAILEKYRLEEIDAYGLRVGTVHSYQGDERDVLVASLAVGAEEADSAWRFVNQRNLFNVMVTRARKELVVVTSRSEPPGLAGEYVQWAEPLSDLTADVEIRDPWVRRVADALTDQGIPVRVGYRVGRHVVDVVAGRGEHAVAIDCGPRGPEAEVHIDRELSLRRLGWRTADAYQTMWKNNPGQFAIELRARFPRLQD